MCMMQSPLFARSSFEAGGPSQLRLLYVNRENYWWGKQAQVSVGCLLEGRSLGSSYVLFLLGALSTDQGQLPFAMDRAGSGSESDR